MRFAAFTTFATLLFLCFAAPAQAQQASDLIGAWDVTVTDGDLTYPSWFDVEKSGTSTLVGRYVGRFGSARPVAEVKYENGSFTFEVPPQWESRKTNVVYQGHWNGDQLTGSTTNDDGKTISWVAVRAPIHSDPKEVSVGDSLDLFDGKSLDGWHARFPEQENGWKVIDGILTNQKPGNDLISDQKFKDFRLSVEFRYPEGSNSGLYLRGRHEVQVEDNYGKPTNSHNIGGVYGFLTPSYNAAKPAGEWQSYDITLVGRRITVVLNGQRVIDHQLIPGITGGALDSNEGEPGPLMVQGDHGPVEFRRIQITPIGN